MISPLDTGRNERLWLVGAGVLALLLVIVGWFLLISPQRTEIAEVDGQAADSQLQNLTLQTRLGQLGAESKNRSKYLAALVQARQALPTQSNMSVFLRDVQKMASATSTRVTALSVGDSTPLASTPPTAATGGSPAAPASNAITSIAIDASVIGSPSALTKFLVRLQNGQPRAVLLTSVTRNSDDGGGAVMQLHMTAFVALEATATPGAATPSAATPSAATPSPGG